MWILIIALHVGLSGTTPVTMTSVGGFKTEEACKAAAKAAKSEMGYGTRVVCVDSGQP